MRNIRRYATFITGGGIGLIINLAITAFLTEALGIWHMASYMVGLAANLVFNFAFHRGITFAKKDKTAHRFSLFVPLTLLIIGANWTLVYIFTEKVTLEWLVFIPILKRYYYLLAITGITGIVSIANYILNRKLVFK